MSFNTFNVLLTGERCILPVRRLCVPFALKNSQTVCKYHLKTAAPISSCIIMEKGKGADRGFYSNPMTCQRILRSGVSSSASSLLAKAGKKFSKMSQFVEEEDIEEELNRYLDGDVENLLDYLKFIVHHNEFSKDTLTATIKILLGRLDHAKSFSQELIFMNCVETLHNQIVTYLDTLDLDTLIHLLDIFVTLQAPGDHSNLTSVLTLLSEKYRGQLNLHQLYWVEAILQKINPISDSPLSAALQKSLPLYFERRLNSPPDPKELEEDMQGLTAHQSEHDLSWKFSAPSAEPNMVQTVVDDVLDGILTLNHVQACNLLLFLTDWNVQQHVHQVDKLLPILFKIVAEKVNNLDPNHVAVLVVNCARRYEAGEEAFYNAEFMNALHANDIRHIQAASIMGHVDEPFLYRVSLLADLPGRLTNPDLLMAYAHYFSTAGILPYHYAPFLEHKFLDQAAQTVHSIRLNVRLTLDLLAMGCKPLVEFVEKVFKPTEESLGITVPFEKCGLRKVGYGPIPLLLIASVLRNLHPDQAYKWLLPSGHTLEELEKVARTQSASWHYPLSWALETAFKGSNYVMTDLWHHGIHIDHCIILHKNDGFPVKIGTHFTLKSLQDEKDKLPVLLKVHPRHHYVANMKQLRGVYALESRILKMFGLPLVDVNLDTWSQLQEGDKYVWLISNVNACWRKTIALV